MAKIIYAVAGEGFGHSSRSHLIGKRFLDAGHNVLFVGSQKSLLYLKQYFGERVKEIFGLSFAYQDGRIDKSETLKQNLVKLPKANRQNDELFKGVFEPFEPDLVISDFEPFSAWWAWRNRVPFISIDHEHMLTLCELEHQRKNWFSRLTAEVITDCYYVGAVSYIIVNFFKTALKIDSAVLAPPIIRPVVRELKASKGEHILLYSTSGKNTEQLKEVLGKFSGQLFIVYGFKETGEFGNCIFKERSTEEFLADLSNCRSVIASAGFSLISECLHLNKRMLLLPVAGQYEQIINAHYIEKLGLGISAEKIDEKAVSYFLDMVDKPLPSDERILWPNNDKFFEILQAELNKLHRPIKITLD
ncbi:glycosyltransferase family protein [Planctomycetota bacterium]